MLIHASEIKIVSWFILIPQEINQKHRWVEIEYKSNEWSASSRIIKVSKY